MFMFTYVFHITPRARLGDGDHAACLAPETPSSLQCGSKRVLGAEQERRDVQRGVLDGLGACWWHEPLLERNRGWELSPSQTRLGVMHGPAKTLGPQVALWRSPSPSLDCKGSFVKFPTRLVHGIAPAESRERVKLEPLTHTQACSH